MSAKYEKYKKKIRNKRKRKMKKIKECFVISKKKGFEIEDDKAYLQRGRCIKPSTCPISRILETSGLTFVRR